MVKTRVYRSHERVDQPITTVLIHHLSHLSPITLEPLLFLKNGQGKLKGRRGKMNLERSKKSLQKLILASKNGRKRQINGNTMVKDRTRKTEENIFEKIAS